VLKDVDKDIVDKTLDDMGCYLDTSVKHIEGVYEAGESDCDGVIVKKNHDVLNLGVILDDGTGHLQIVGDFYGSGFNAMDFQESLCQTYQKINIMTQAELNGWSVDESTVQTTEDGSVEMELYMYA
jgi:hypothetical protein